VTVDEYGQIGPQAIELVDLIVSRARDPVTLKTYTMRRLAVVTATQPWPPRRSARRIQAPLAWWGTT
jgi:hypothetical protein